MSHPKPISQELFKELVALKKADNENDNIFLPFIGNRYFDKGNRRLMFVGKATAGWKEGDATIENCLAESAEFIRGQVATGTYRSLFWYFMVEFSKRVHANTDREQVLERIVWSNTMKVGCKGTQPTGRKAREQVDLAKRILLYEIGTLKPDIIVLTVGSYQSDLIKSVFSADWTKLPGVPDHFSKTWTWCPVADRFPKALVFWTRHPQGWKKESREAEVNAMCNLMGERPRNEDLEKPQAWGSLH